MQHFQRARGDARRARHATSCSAQLFARSSEWRARRRRAARAAGWNAPARSDAICSEFSFGSVLLHGFARVCDARATDWDASRVIHGRTLLCTAVNYADPIYDSAILWLLWAAARARVKTNVKSGGAVQQRCVVVQVCSRPRDQWSRCAHQGRSMGLPRRRRRERNGEHPTPTAAASTTASRPK